MSKPWFRLYSEFVSDPKIQLLAFEDQRHFVAILCLKCNGTLDTESVSKEHHERLIAKAIGLDPASASEAKRRLMEVGLIDADWTPVKWAARQYESDSSTSRVHKWRLKQSETLQKRSSNDDVSFKSRADTEQIQSRAEQKTTARKAEPAEFAILWSKYPPRAGANPKGRALRAANARLSEGATWAEMIAGVERYAEYIRQTGKANTEYVRQAATFLGPDKSYLDRWAIPATKAQAAQDQNIVTSLKWLQKGSHA